MNLIEALKKYKKVTNDEGKTIYTLNENGAIVMYNKESKCGGGFLPTIELFTSIGWKEYIELEIPMREYDKSYYSIDHYGDIDCYKDSGSKYDKDMLEMYNYFTDIELADYIVDKQYIQRAKLVLEYLNRDKENRDILIAEYIKSKHKDIIERIKEYEEKYM